MCSGHFFRPGPFRADCLAYRCDYKTPRAPFPDPLSIHGELTILISPA